MAPVHLLDPLGHEPNYIFKMTKNLESESETYLLPVATFLGFISTLLKRAKKSSHGATLNE